MKPPPFDYHVADSVDHALALLADLGDDAKLLAGGQSLLPLLSLRVARPESLVDINGLSALSRVDTSRGLRIGALVRQRVVEKDERVAAANPLLAAAAHFIGHAAIRNRGTIGGTVSHADPAAEIPTVVVALDAEIEVATARSARTIAAPDFFHAFLTTALQPDEMITALRFPAWTPGTGWSFREFSRRSGDFAVAGTAVTIAVRSDGRIDEARIALSGVAEIPVRARQAEALLSGAEPSETAWEAAAAEAVEGLEPPADLHGSSAYRVHVARGLVKQALQEAWLRAEVPA